MGGGIWYDGLCGWGCFVDGGCGDWMDSGVSILFCGFGCLVGFCVDVVVGFV